MKVVTWPGVLITEEELCGKTGTAGSDEDQLREGPKFKSTPLHYAAYGGHTDMARLLIEKGADVNARNSEQVGVVGRTSSKLIWAN